MHTIQIHDSIQSEKKLKEKRKLSMQSNIFFVLILSPTSHPSSNRLRFFYLNHAKIQMQILFGKLWNAQKLIDVLFSFVSSFSLRLWYFSENSHCHTLPQYSYHPHFWTHMVSSIHVPIERKMKENLTWNISVYYSFLFHYYCIFFNLKHWEMLC